MKEKQCSACGLEKDQSEFYKISKNKDGLSGYCKECSYNKREGLFIDNSWKNIIKCEKGYIQCNSCKEVLKDQMFHKDSRSRSGYKHDCKECRNRVSKRYHKPLNKVERTIANLDQKEYRQTLKGRHTAAMAAVKSNYNITEPMLQQMLFNQKGCCAICNIDFGNMKITQKRHRSYSIDHNHKSGKVRGLLCSACNFYLAQVELNHFGPEIFTAYLEETL